MCSLINQNFQNHKLLTLRRPLRQSWRLGMLSSSHGWALAAISKRWKNIPHKSSIADFLKLVIFMQDACWTHKTRLKILDCDFTYYGVYSFWTFCVCLNFFVQSLKNKFKNIYSYNYNYSYLKLNLRCFKSLLWLFPRVLSKIRSLEWNWKDAWLILFTHHKVNILK